MKVAAVMLCWSSALWSVTAKHLRPIETVCQRGVLVCRDRLLIGMLDYSTLKQLPPACGPQCFVQIVNTPQLVCLLDPCPFL